MNNPYYQPSDRKSELVQAQYALGHLCTHSTQALSHMIDVADQFNEDTVDAVLGDLILVNKDVYDAIQALTRLKQFAVVPK